jgi:nucleotide-binding universal stress UspA family protein
MERMAARLKGLPHETMVELDLAVGPVLQEMIQRNHIDLVLMRTYGRSDVQKFLLGSVPEQITRRSTVCRITACRIKDWRPAVTGRCGAVI